MSELSLKWISRLTAESLRDRIAYDCDTGEFVWLKTPQHSYVGTIANRMNKKGYEVVRIWGHPFSAHRLAWLYVTGSWPSGDIDHINGDSSDNRFSNLRCVDNQINRENLRKSHGDSVTQYLGVSRHGKSGFQARIRVKGKTIFLGTHKTPEAAHMAYLNAKRTHHQGCTI